jgi:hypothetical protein
MAKKTTKGKVVKQPEPKKKPVEKKPEPKRSDFPGYKKFKESIVAHLKDYARKDKLFLKVLQKKNKNIDDCITYIMNQAMKASMQGVAGFHDDDVYKMARHYYDEDDIKLGAPITNAQVMLNQQIELSEDEVAKAKTEAREKVIAEEMARMRKKPEKKKAPVVPITKPAEASKKEEKKEEEKVDAPAQGSLF